MNACLSLASGFQPPLEFQLGIFSLEALSPKHNERDFETLISSKEKLRAIIDPNDFWPDEVLSLEDNLRDLTKDFREFLDRSTFRYAILSSDKSSYDGCLYIRPTDAVGYDCRIEFWFKPTCQTLEREFQESVKAWLSAYWGFRRMVFPGREISWNEYRNLCALTCDGKPLVKSKS